MGIETAFDKCMIPPFQIMATALDSVPRAHAIAGLDGARGKILIVGMFVKSAGLQAASGGRQPTDQ
jgi:hypothetical protein